MDKNKVRYIPPIVVSVVVAIVLAIVAVAQLDSKAEQRAAQPPMATIGAADMSYTQTEEPTEAPPETTESAPEYTSIIGSRDWDCEDTEILLKIAMAEAEGESVEGKALVMLVVLNRVWSDEFPGTIEEVVFQPRQFSPVREGGRYYTTEPDEGCYKALEMVEQGWDESYGALYFESCEGGSWHSDNLEFLFQVGNHKFYK